MTLFMHYKLEEANKGFGGFKATLFVHICSLENDPMIIESVRDDSETLL